MRQTFLEAELVLAAGLEVVEGYEELRVVLLLGQQVLLGGPARGRLQGQRRRSGGGRLALRQVRDVRQRPALQQRLCNTPRHGQSSHDKDRSESQVSYHQPSTVFVSIPSADPLSVYTGNQANISSIQAEDIRSSI